MPGLIEVTWCPNPLRPVADRQIKRLLATGGDTVDSVIHRLGLHVTPLSATLNAVPVRRRRWCRKSVRPGDVLVLVQRAKGVEAAAATKALITDLAWYEIAALYITTAITSDLAISLAISVLANALTSKRGNSGAAGNTDTAVAAFSIEGGSNSARPYSPLPLVLGEHRIFPDYASRPFSEFVVDPTTAYPVINDTPALEDRSIPLFTFTGTPPEVNTPWTVIATVGDLVYYGDNAERTYTMRTGEVTKAHTFVIRRDSTSVDVTVVTTFEDYEAGLPPPDTGGGGGS